MLDIQFCPADVICQSNANSVVVTELALRCYHDLNSGAPRAESGRGSTQTRGSVKTHHTYKTHVYIRSQPYGVTRRGACGAGLLVTVVSIKSMFYLPAP